MIDAPSETTRLPGQPIRQLPAWRVDVGIVVLSMAAMAIMLATAPSFGAIVYLLPLLALLMVLGSVGIATLLVGTPRALVVFLFLVTIALDLNFRARAAGETGLDWQNGMKLGAWMLMLVLALRYASPWRAVANDPAVRLLVAFCLFCLCSAAWSPVTSYTFACAMGGLAWAALAFVCATRLTDAQTLRALVVALACECAVGLVVGTLLPDLGWLQDYDSDGVRLAGLSGHPNLLGQHAALLVLITAAAYECQAIRKSRWIAIELLALLTLLLTGSRTAILAMLAALLIVHLRTHVRAARIVMPALFAGSAVFLLAKAAGMMPDFDGLFALLSRSGNASEIMTATNRSDLWVIAWHHFLERPLLGWGFNGTEQLMLDSVDSNFPGNAVNAHNIVFQGLMSLGLIGSALVFGYFLILSSRLFTQPDPLRDRIVIFCLALGVGEAELLSIPLVMSFLTFWCVFRDARLRTSRGTAGARVRCAFALLRRERSVSMPRARILLWHWGYAGAGSKFTLDLAAALTRRDCIPCCISAARQSELAARATADTTIPVRLVSAPPRRGMGWRCLAQALRCLGIPLAVARTLDETQPNVALCTMQTIWDLFALSPLRRRGIRYVLILHDAWFRPGDTYPLRAWALRRQVRASDGLIVLSDHVGKIAQSTFAYPASRIVTIPHGAFRFESQGSMTPRERRRGQPLRLLFLGRIVAYKGLGLLLEAYQLARRRGANVVLGVFGDGDVSAMSEQLTDLPDLQLENRWLDEAEIADALRSHDVVVLPYIEATQSGIAAAAFAAALPCIATPVGGLTEQVADGRTGLIAPALSAGALADTIVRLSGDDRLYADLSRGALRHAQEDLSWDRVGTRTLTFLDAIRVLPARSEDRRTKTLTHDALQKKTEVRP